MPAARQHNSGVRAACGLGSAGKGACSSWRRLLARGWPSSLHACSQTGGPGLPSSAPPMVQAALPHCMPSCMLHSQAKHELPVCTRRLGEPARPFPGASAHPSNTPKAPTSTPCSLCHRQYTVSSFRALLPRMLAQPEVTSPSGLHRWSREQHALLAAPHKQGISCTHSMRTARDCGIAITALTARIGREG